MVLLDRWMIEPKYNFFEGILGPFGYKKGRVLVIPKTTGWFDD